MADTDICITASDLRFSADGKQVLHIPELTVPRHGVTVILGPNGAGKSVLLRILHGILKPASGRVVYSNNGAQPRQAMVFQRPVLLRRTVAANIRFALSANHDPKQTCGALLEKAGLSHRAHQPARTLSGGEQQRLAMVRALATDPEILFLDEPTASLDPAATLAIEDMISDASNSGTKVVMVTHDIAQARRLADDILFCHAGMIVETAPSQRFFSAPESPEAASFLKGLLVP